MIARELMNRHFPYVTADADVDYVAKLLSECDIGVVPVVDEALSPIGIVTRSNLERARAPIRADLGDIPPFLLRNRAKPTFHPGPFALRDIMTSPAISVSSGAALPEIAKVMEDHHLKRAPVVDGHKLVGFVLLREVIQAIASGGALPPHERPVLSIRPRERNFCEVATAEEFRQLVAAHERELEAERDERRRAVAEMREQRIRELAAQRLTDAQWRELLANARKAASAGLAEHMLTRFPSQLCVDGGRAINAPDPHWPETLRGEPADVFRRWRNELHPRGFKIAAQIIDFPQGLPGDAALFLMWGGRS
ncbi:CBS domain-containing protein [Methylocystis sp. JAN1]|uniref:CBS domain-containing protein n=1 Tax=Methylocystis sp. JAN1 TaxID=3397211 RepID=UPI003FA306C2